ncbi:hypothetical protein AVEN_123018-1, partial [Araneus ventricosus]
MPIIAKPHLTAPSLNIDVITVQDPYMIPGRPMKPAPGYKMYSSKN